MADSKEDYIFSVESPNSGYCCANSAGWANVSCGDSSGSQSSSQISTANSSSSRPYASAGNSQATNSSSSGGGGIIDLNPQAYAGRPLESSPTAGPDEFSSSTYNDLLCIKLYLSTSLSRFYVKRMIKSTKTTQLLF